MSAHAFLAGFFRDPPTANGAPGKPSMTRLAIAVLLACTVALVILLCWYVHAHRAADDKPDALVIGAIVGGITALVLNGIVALRNRKQTGESAT